MDTGVWSEYFSLHIDYLKEVNFKQSTQFYFLLSFIIEKVLKANTNVKLL